MTSKRLYRSFDRFSTRITHWTGHPLAFFAALAVVLAWLVTGPMFGYSDTWQLLINTGTTVVTFLMVFVIQQSQNKDTLALQLKLNELIASHEGASNRLINSEDLTEEELRVLKQFYIKLAELAKKEQNLLATHSIDEAHARHSHKVKTAPSTKKPA